MIAELLPVEAPQSNPVAKRSQFPDSLRYPGLGTILVKGLMTVFSRLLTHTLVVCDFTHYALE